MQDCLDVDLGLEFSYGLVEGWLGRGIYLAFVVAHAEE